MGFQWVPAWGISLAVCCRAVSSNHLYLTVPTFFFPLQLLDVDQNFNNQFAFTFVIAGSVHWWLCSQAFCLRGVIFYISLYFHKWFRICFADFTYRGPSLSNMLFHPQPGNGRMEKGTRKQFYILSLSFQSLSLARLVIYMRPGPVMDVLRISAQRFSTFPNSISCTNIINPEVFHFS